jgi:hypothetical protein
MTPGRLRHNETRTIARPGFPAELHSLPKPRAVAALGTVLTRTGRRRASIQESLLRTGEIYDTVRMAQYVPTHRADQQICYLDALFSERYKAMLIAADRYPDVDIPPLGNFAAHVPGPLRPVADHRRSQRLLPCLVRRSEDRTVHRFGTSLLLNEQEVVGLCGSCRRIGRGKGDC